MARIRTIKPEFWTSEQIMDCNPITRLLFIGLWNFVDDFGRAPVAPRTIKAQIFPGDSLTGDDVLSMLHELSSRGLILFYAAQGKEYLEITGWSKHQRIDNPSKHKVYPAPFVEESEKIAIPREGSETIGLEGKGRERNSNRKKQVSCAVGKPTRTTDEKDFEEFWKAYPRRKGPADKAKARKAYGKQISAGTSSAALLAGAKAYAAEQHGLGKVDTEFIKMCATWLNGRCWEDYAAPPSNSDFSKPPWDREGITESQWRERELAKISPIRRDSGGSEGGADQPAKLQLTG